MFVRVECFMQVDKTTYTYINTFMYIYRQRHDVRLLFMVAPQLLFLLPSKTPLHGEKLHRQNIDKGDVVICIIFPQNS